VASCDTTVKEMGVGDWVLEPDLDSARALAGFWLNQGSTLLTKSLLYLMWLDPTGNELLCTELRGQHVRGPNPGLESAGPLPRQVTQVVQYSRPCTT
jgi:hypothetical protein